MHLHNEENILYSKDLKFKSSTTDQLFIELKELGIKKSQASFSLEFLNHNDNWLLITIKKK